MHPHQNPAYAQNEHEREKARRHNSDPSAVTRFGKISLPKMVNKYLPHQGAKEIARRMQQEARANG